MKVGDAARRLGQGAQLVGRTLGHGAVDFRGGDGEAAALDTMAVEAARIFEQGVVAAAAHIGDDGRDRVVDVLGRLALVVEQQIEGRLEMGVGQIESTRHRHPPGNARSSRPVPRAGS